MKPQLYIHIGFPKTGSSTIQKFCHENCSQLKKLGIYYPEPCRNPVLHGRHEGHLEISEGAASLFPSRLSWKKYINIYFHDILQAKYDVNILSSEGLCSDNPANLKPFRDIFDTRIICFFRNIFDFFSSHQKEIVKQGLRPDLFSHLARRNYCFFYQVEQYVNFFSLDKCIFLNYNRLSKGNSIIDEFFKSMHIDLGKYTIKNANITPSSISMMFFYQLSFLPFTYSEWRTLRSEVLQMDFSSWRSYRCTLLPPSFFVLDDEAKCAIRRQGELLQDPGWYDYTMTRGEELAAIENHDLPPEIQHDIWEKLSDEARSIILRYWPKAGQAKHNEPLLPALEKIAPDVFEQMTVLRHGYTVSIGNRLRLQGQLAASEAARTELDQASQREWQCSAHRRAIAARHCEPDTFFSRLRACLAPLASSLARQAYDIRRSGLFDTGWYLERYADVAAAGIDPVLHYVRFGVKEGRDPAPWFSTNAYLQAYPDVAASGVNPFYHYIRYGYAEGRRSFDC